MLNTLVKLLDFSADSRSIEIDMDIVSFFVEPLNAQTNRKIGLFLGQKVHENECSEKKCIDGVTRNLWRVSRQELVTFLVNENSVSLDFKVYAENSENQISEILIIREPSNDLTSLRNSIENQVDTKKVQEIFEKIQDPPKTKPEPTNCLPFNVMKKKDIRRYERPQKIRPTKALNLKPK